MKLNLGSGPIKKEGYLNIDAVEDVDVKLDLRKSLPFDVNSVDEIFASHVIEHFSKEEWKVVKKDWYRVLKFGGKLFIECPDFPKMCKDFLDEPNHERKWNYRIMPIYGAQKDEYDFHRNGFDIEKLSKELEEEGFKVIASRHVGQASMQVEVTK